MKNNRTGIEYRFPVFARLASTSIETIAEAYQKKPAIAFFNNVISLGIVGTSLDDLRTESEAYQDDVTGENKRLLLAYMNEEFNNHKLMDQEMLKEIFEIVCPTIFMLVGVGSSLEKVIRKHQDKE